MSLQKFNKKVFIQLIQEHFRSKLKKRSEYEKLNGLQRDHSPALSNIKYYYIEPH